MKTLVILAAGWGSRYGGLKQVDGFGPSGESLMDYSVFDAQKAGFGKFVFVIREELRPIFDKKFATPLYKNLQCSYVLQSLKDVPKFVPSRKKPWGTAHAVYACRQTVKEAFCVINADDFYGLHSYEILAQFLSQNPTENELAMVGFRLNQTLSQSGGVSRGICRLQGNLLSHIEEKTQLHYDDSGQIIGKNQEVFFGDEVVSMNCWAFTQKFFEILTKDMEEFFKKALELEQAEFMLPNTVQSCIQQGMSVKVYPSTSPSFGITFLEDKQVVKDKLAGMCREELYPKSLHQAAIGQG